MSNVDELAQCQAAVCAILCGKGWVASVMTAKDAQGVVTAEYREKQLAILCDPSTTPVGDEAVYRIYAYCCDHGGDFAAIVSNATYTASESRLALGTRVLLIQPDQLDLLQELIFGLSAIEPQQLFRVELE